MKLSVIIPIFNEKNNILEILKRVEQVDLGDIKKEIILVDDGSTDGTREILKNLEEKYLVIYHPENQGKGMAIRNGFARADGDIILVQDSDLEYDPQNYPALIKPILEGKADVVYGSRFLNKEFRHIFFLSNFANKFLTKFSNLLTGLHLTDMWTGCKVFKKEAIKEILPRLTAERFEIELELTAQVSKKKYRICEVSLSFQGQPRTCKEGKKRHWLLGVVSIWNMTKFNLFR